MEQQASPPGSRKMMRDPLAYRCSADFSAAITARLAARREYMRTNMQPIIDETGLGFAWRRIPGRMAQDWPGFTLTVGRAVPTGLSMSLASGYARPVRGPRGDVWRERLEVARAVPDLDDVFESHGVPTCAEGEDGAILGITLEFAADGTVYLSCLGDLLTGEPTGAITRCTLEEFYGVREAGQALRARAAAGDRR